MKLFATFVVALTAMGCGDPGSSGGDAGADPNAVCRAPAGCTATLDSGRCSILCDGDAGQFPVVCVRTAMGVVRATGVEPWMFLESPFVVRNVRADPMNCNECGAVCPSAMPRCEYSAVDRRSFCVR